MLMRTVAILVFPGVQSLDVSGPLDVFAEANRFLPPEQHYRIEVLGTQEGLMACSNGMPLAAHRHYARSDDAYDLLLMAGGPSLPGAPRDDALCTWLADAAARARRFGSICNGAFLLARAGLLEGRNVATHWNDAPALAAQFPGVRVDADSIYLRDGELYTSAGVTAGIDLSLYLLAQDHGADVALSVAKRLVVFTQRRGGQSQFSPYLTPQLEQSSPVAQVQQHVRDHLDADLTVEELARRVSMSARNFARVFVRDAGMTPAEFIERARVDAARVMLESSDLPLKTVAFRCGFGNANHLRQVFQKRLGLTARQYRSNFGAVYGDAVSADAV
jgi:transcriptional regulator GlxA family with amidase domain